MAIVQGGLDPGMRHHSAEQLVDLDFPGYAIGGLSVGESPEEMYAAIEVTEPHLPEDKPRYLMGVGRPQDLLESVRRGIDMFDCVMPTRNGRNGMAFTDNGPLKMRNLQHRLDSRPLQPDLDVEFFNVNGRKGVVLDQFLADDNRVLKIEAFKRHERNQHVTS